MGEKSCVSVVDVAMLMYAYSSLYHSIEEHPKISKIAKFGREML